MSRFLRTFLVVSVVAVIGLPALADAQAKSRGGSSQSGGSRSGSVGRAPSSRPAPSRPTASRPPAAKPRATNPAPTSKSASSTRPSSAASVGVPLSGTANSERALRARQGQGAVGLAAARPLTAFDTTFLPGHQHSRFGFRFGFGSGLNRGFGSFGLGGYGSSLFLPYGRYAPYGYNAYGRSRSSSAGPARMGSVRLKVSPRSARVYIDGALVGVVDDFDGLTQQLELEAGRYALELRADGYQTYVGEVSVSPGRTKTERISMQPIKK